MKSRGSNPIGTQDRRSEMSWLLTDEEMEGVVDLAEENTYPVPDGSWVGTFDCRPIAKAQLRHVVEMVEATPQDNRWHAATVIKWHDWQQLRREAGLE